LDFSIGTCLSLQQLRYETDSDYFDIVFTTICAGIVIGLIIALVVILNRNPDLENPNFQDRYGSITDSYKTSGIHVGDTKKIIVWFLIRRLLAGIIMVLLAYKSICFQLFANLILTIVDTCVSYNLNVYENKVNFYMAMFNDTIVLFLSYFPFLFTDFILDLETRYYAGWIYVAIVGLMLVTNLVVVMRESILTMAEDIRRKSVELHNYRLVEKRKEIEIQI